jgi:hypothetical protein
MKNMPQQQQGRKIVELSFDPESKKDFPNLTNQTQRKSATKLVTSTRSQESKKSEALSESDTVSAVTRADFQTLGDDLREMLRTKAKSVLTSGTDITLVTLLCEELEANRLENINNNGSVQRQQPNKRKNTEK